ncbi:hypothetical protein [Mesorhizobium sp. M0146]|uniref:hypothetical protein n=1 Tax=unclassified Mesorhizobium TaxID=325217 RepID=UPI0033372AC3
MIFEATPEFIKTLDGTKLVEFMRRLLLAECRLTGLPLRAASVPLQVTVADGGEDGRVEWAGGPASTAYFPDRFTLFQAKATNLTTTKLRNEILKRKKKGDPVVLSEAISDVLAQSGAYIVFCSHPFVEATKKKFVAAMWAAIKDGGGDPAKAAAIEFFDANKIADWTNTHPAVALWLVAQQRGRSLAGFQTHDGWGKQPAIATVPWVPSEAPRYAPLDRTIPDAQRKNIAINAWTFDQAERACRAGMDGNDRIVRVVGPSGFGKSRFVYELLKDGLTVADQSAMRSVIFADFLVVGDELLKLALEIADSGSTVTLVADECPDDVHRKLAEFAGREGSQLRLITVNVETKFTHVRGTLTIRLERADDATIEAIAKSAAPALRQTDAHFVAELANGFPQMAVLGAQQNGDGRDTIRSADQVLDRVIWGDRPHNDEAQKALEVLSLFEWVGFKGLPASEATFVAAKLAGMTAEQFVDLILSFKQRGIIETRGSYFQVLPIPLAARLGASRLGRLSSDALVRIFSDAPEELKASLLKRMRWLDTSPTAKAFASALLSPEGVGNLAALNTEFGAKCFDRLVHVDPDRAAATIDRVLFPLSHGELQAIRDGRNYLVWALQKLAFRKESFDRSAVLLRRLAATEVDNGHSTGAGETFKQLYQLHLSGTEADPAARLRVLDEGLSSLDAAERQVSIDALEQMIATSHFSRGGGAEEIGSAQPLQDWFPQIYSEIWDFHRAGMRRLTDFALSGGPYAEQAKTTIARHLRGLISSVPFEDVSAMIDRIVAHSGLWPDAIEAVTAWLYFDARGTKRERVAKVRAYFDELMPDDPVDKVIVYTHGWPADFHAPDTRYDRGANKNHDFEYSGRESAKLAPAIAADPDALDRALGSLCCREANNVFAFARALAFSAADPVELFRLAVAKLDGGLAAINRQLFRGLIAGTDARDPVAARECIRAALRAPKLKDDAISMIGSGKLQPGDLEVVIALLASGDVEPWRCAALSYGRGLEHLSSAEIMPLLDALRKKGAAGLWAALDIVFMYLLGGKPPSPGLVRTIKSVLLAPDLYNKVNQGPMDGHHFFESVELLAKHGAIDAKFARAMTAQIVKLSRVPSGDVFFALDDPAREALQQLLKSHPPEAWEVLSSHLENEDPVLRHGLNRLIDRDREDWLGAGTLFELPRDLYLGWVRAKPTKRASIIVPWLPLAVKQHDSSLVWHPAMASFVEEFSSQPDVLRGLSGRLRPGMWSDSLASYLEPLIPMVSTWQNHPVPAIRAWANSAIDNLRRWIDEEREEDDDDLHR